MKAPIIRYLYFISFIYFLISVLGFLVAMYIVVLIFMFARSTKCRIEFESINVVSALAHIGTPIIALEFQSNGKN